MYLQEMDCLYVIIKGFSCVPCSLINFLANIGGR